MRADRAARSAGMMATMTLLTACGGGGGSSPAPVVVDPPQISVQPVAQSVLTDGRASFAVTASGSNLSYQWLRNGTAISGANTASYSPPAAGWQDQGASFTVTVSNAAGTVTSAAATLTLVASANQQLFESLSLLPATGSEVLHWNLNLAGGQTSGTNYLFSDFFQLPKSPLTQGPQSSQQSVPVPMANTLAAVTPPPTRVLKDGVILVVPSTQGVSRISYVGSDVQVDSMAADRTTVAYSQLRTDYSFTSLSGALSASPSEFRQWHNSIFANPAVLQPAAVYNAGAGYLRYTATSRGDRYTVQDCGAATTDNNPSPCVSASTLTAALTAGIVSAADGTTHRLADGTQTTVGGVPVWVASSPRPVAATLSGTVQYRVYIQLGSNVYGGALIKDGAVLGGSFYVSNPAGATVAERLSFLPFHIRLNKAARDSIAGALAL